MTRRAALLVVIVALVTGASLFFRDQPAPASTTAAPPEPPRRAQPAAAPPRSAAEPAPISAPPGPPDFPPRATNEEHEARQHGRAAYYLSGYADPVRRAALLERELDARRRSSAGLAERLHLTPEQAEHLAELLADEAIAKRVAAARCIVSAGCDTAALDSSIFGARDQDIRDIVGDGGLQELRAVRDADAERAAVSNVQARLGQPLALSATQADDLALALFDSAQERRRAGQLRQEHLSVYALPGGAALLYADDLPSEAQMSRSGEEYVQKMRDRAATQLTGERLAAFNGMCDDLLVSFRGFLRATSRPAAAAGDRTP